MTDMFFYRDPQEVEQEQAEGEQKNYLRSIIRAPY